MKTSTMLYAAGGAVTLAVLYGVWRSRQQAAGDPMFPTDLTETLGEATGLDATSETANFQAPAPPPLARNATTVNIFSAIKTPVAKVGSAPISSTTVTKSPAAIRGLGVGTTSTPVAKASSVSNLGTSTANAMLNALCADHRLLDTVPAAQREQWRQAMIAKGCLSSTISAQAPSGGGFNVPAGSYGVMSGRRGGLMARLGL